jgi:hypothetical protein
MTTQFKVLKQRKWTKQSEETPREASHDAFIHRPPPTPAPSQAGSLRATHQQRHYLEQQIIAKLSILILNKTYPSVITTSPTLTNQTTKTIKSSDLQAGSWIALYRFLQNFLWSNKKQQGICTIKEKFIQECTKALNYSVTPAVHQLHAVI